MNYLEFIRELISIVKILAVKIRDGEPIDDIDGIINKIKKIEKAFKKHIKDIQR